MLPENFDPSEPSFTFKEAVSLTQVDESTLENWIEWKRIVPTKIGRRRMLSFEQLLKVDVMFVLAKSFRVEPSTGVTIADATVEQYLPQLPTDVSEIRAGLPWHSPMSRDGWTFDLTRDENTGELRATRREDRQEASVMLVVPVRVLSRRILESMAGEDAVMVWADKAAD